MSSGSSGTTDSRSAEERAEDMMERMVNDGSRVLRRLWGRVREEAEDIVAEARSRTDRPRGSST